MCLEYFHNRSAEVIGPTPIVSRSLGSHALYPKFTSLGKSIISFRYLSELSKLTAFHYRCGLQFPEWDFKNKIGYNLRTSRPIPSLYLISDSAFRLLCIMIHSSLDYMPFHRPPYETTIRTSSGCHWYQIKNCRGCNANDKSAGSVSWWSPPSLWLRQKVKRRNSNSKPEINLIMS